ncbi:hypothetical protein JCM8097_003285 [Rhodosporidiobolus ruineniae]
MAEQPIPTLYFAQLGLSGQGEEEEDDPLPPSLSLSLDNPSGPPSLPPLFLSIDAGVSKLHACVLSERLEVVWTATVEVDDELPEYGASESRTRNGVYTLSDVVTALSEMRIHALDLLLEKLSRDCPDPNLLSRVKAVSGTGQPYTLHYLTPSFPTLLQTLTTAPQARLSSVLNATDAFSLAAPATGGDSSTVAQVRGLEAHSGRVALAAATAGGTKEKETPEHLLPALGRAHLVRLTGQKPSTRSGAAQMIKVRQADEREREEGRLRRGVMERTGAVRTEGAVLASVFLGRLAPTDAADACSTGLFNPVAEDWDDSVLEYVMTGASVGGSGEAKGGEGATRLREMLGEVEVDGGAELGKISPYFVQRFGFSPDCIITPFTSPTAATFLSFPLYSSPTPSALFSSSPGEAKEEWRDALLSLSTGGGDTDDLLVPAAAFVPAVQPHLPKGGIGNGGENVGEWSVWSNPARGWWEVGEDGEGEGEEQGGRTRFVASVSSRDAGIGRALVRDLYANGEWRIFSHLSAIVPHGGTIGLDDKHFSFFFPHGEASVAQGFLRFVAGARVQEFPDRKANPRLLLESQFMSLRLRLSHIYRALTSSLSALDTPPTRPFDSLHFPPLSPHVLPSRLILTGAPAQNPAISSLLSTVFDAPAFLPTEGGLRSFAKTAPGGQPDEAEEELDDGRGRMKTTASALGAAYKAAWAYRRATASEEGSESTMISFQRFLREGIEALAEAREQGGAAAAVKDAEEDDEGRYSHPSGTQYSTTASSRLTGSGTGTTSTASTTRSTAPTHFSLPRPSLSRSRSAPATGTGAAHQSASAPTSVHGGVLGGRLHAHEQSPEAQATDELEPDPPGLSLVAMPDRDEFKYYSSMLPEFARLERYAVRGLI